jgi:hypothetical protein
MEDYVFCPRNKPMQGRQFGPERQLEEMTYKFGWFLVVRGRTEHRQNNRLFARRLNLNVTLNGVLYSLQETKNVLRTIRPAESNGKWEMGGHKRSKIWAG